MNDISSAINIPILLLILGMAAVTYIPRAIPAVLIDKLNFGPRVEKFLRLIPYTAMAAMIFPGIFTVDSAHPAIGIIGGVVAGILAWKKLPLMIAVLGAILADMLLYIFIF